MVRQTHNGVQGIRLSKKARLGPVRPLLGSPITRVYGLQLRLQVGDRENPHRARPREANILRILPPAGWGTGQGEDGDFSHHAGIPHLASHGDPRRDSPPLALLPA
ncbi:hypothetical protein Sjap_021669 [Stephania japonica]|uniref:Uncharacterized protein n=1 Tax=Stephania japonica TaxID=461633 RepID=A0AAP0EQJ5_9MAGN